MERAVTARAAGGGVEEHLGTTPRARDGSGVKAFTNGPN